MIMCADRPGARRIEEFVLFDLLRTVRKPLNRKVRGSELDGIEGDQAATSYIKEQDQEIAEMSGKPRGPINSATRASRR